MEPNMRKIGWQISLRMGVTLSLCLSLVGGLFGQLSSGTGFRLPAFIISFLLSFLASLIISLLIGLLVPMKKVTDNFSKKHGLKPGKLKTLLAEALISDLIYTPLITVIMVILNYALAFQNGARIPVPGMVIGLLESLLLCFVTGYVLIFFFMPLYMRMVFEKNGINGPGAPKH